MSDPVIRAYTDPGRPDWSPEAVAGTPRPVRAYLWEPAARPVGGPPPVLLMSHGTGGSARDLAWLAEELALAGYLVAGVDHHGNNWVDGYLPEGFAFSWERPRDLGFVLERLREERELGAVGAVGFSLGGYTAAATVGARIAPEHYRAVAERLVPMPPLPEYPDLLDAIDARYRPEEREPIIRASGADRTVPEVAAAFLICPGIGGLVDQASLEAVRRPVAIRWGGADDNSPGPGNALYYAEHIPGAEVACAGEEVGHYLFVDGSASGEPVRRQVARDAVEFFGRTLSGPAVAAGRG
ncbi:alpha/beta hydrolase family protein [Kitasatospora sp. NPDC096147]|uniref:alpha/beta hydrolase family protein n=1 Tax=Kitasatospora sp. NPDC096147 TaxID=3364093 RepID=UPI00382E5BDE